MSTAPLLESRVKVPNVFFPRLRLLLIYPLDTIGFRFGTLGASTTAHVGKRPVEIADVRAFDLTTTQSARGCPKALHATHTAILVARVDSCSLNMFLIPKSSPCLLFSPCTPSKYLKMGCLSNCNIRRRELAHRVCRLALYPTCICCCLYT